MIFKVHIFNMVNTDGYYPHKQKLCRDSSKPKSIKKAGDQRSLRFNGVKRTALISL